MPRHAASAILWAVALALSAGCAPRIDKPVPPAPGAFLQNQRLGRGVNLGNALEAPGEGEWGVTLIGDYFRLIRQAGFNSVRIPVRWSAHASTNAPYEIEPAFLARADWAVGQALSNGLAVVLDVHHYEELMRDPGGHKERFLAIWKQLAAHYRGYPDELMLELLNEPTHELKPELWNEYLAGAVRVIRAADPRRTLVIGCAKWSNWPSVRDLVIPPGETNVIITFHYYYPFEFTHQGASWIEGSDQWLGRTWEGTETERRAVSYSFDEVARWAQADHRPVLLGEFGAYSRADMESRARWTAFVAREAERHGFSWAYWEFGATFGVYDPGRGAWRQPLLDALIPRSNHE